MNKLHTFLLGIILSAFTVAHAQTDPRYVAKTVPNDPMGVQIYTLANGLTVYISVNKDEPRIQTQIAVRAGSKNDPADCTGLAHYLEHMLFKGSSEIATLNWEEEKKLLQQISDLYEMHKSTSDPARKKEIYKKIDSLSFAAAAFAVPNEYDKMISSIGAEGTNAYTSNEQTVYINNIPSNEMEKWLMVESNRFNELVLRLFHTELETVYEEFNRGQDNDNRKIFKKLSEKLFPTHPYGTQPTIGHGEHLKNPSMVKIHEYFKQYYVPNNMCISLAGDLDPLETVRMIDKYFGKMKPGTVPEFKFTPEKPITSSISDTVYGPSAESVWIGFRNEGAHSKNILYLELIDGILNNGKAGLLDLNLVQKQKVIRAGTGLTTDHDYSSFYFYGIARKDQSLAEVKTLLLAQLDSLKQGKFDDWLVEAVINDIKLNQTRGLESNWNRSSLMTDAFILKKDWNTVVNHLSELSKITKTDIVNFAKTQFQNNYVAVFKVKGEDKSVMKVDKPQITPLNIERSTQSKFFERFSQMKGTRMQPVWVDYNTAIQKSALTGGTELNYIKNPTNNLFSLHYILDMGSDHDKKMALAISYLPYLGTSKYSAEDLQKEFFKLGLTFNVSASRDQIYVSLEGLDDSFEKGVALFEHILSSVTPDEQAYKDLIAGIEKKRADAKLNKGSILSGGLKNYARYGAKSPFTDILSMDVLNSIQPAELTGLLKSLLSYQHRIFYYGKQDIATIATVLNKHHKITAPLKPYPAPVVYTELATNKNEVFVAHYDMVQAELLMLSNAGKFNKDLLPVSSVFNEFFGSGLSSIVFQEIREAKALAYSAYAAFSSPSKTDESHYVNAYIGTQSDKLKDATAAISELMNNMPEAQRQFDDAILAALKKIETERITKEDIFWSSESAKKRGYNYDYRKDLYGGISKLNMQQMKDFFNTHIKGKQYWYLVIGKKENLDVSTLNNLGPVKELTLEEIFGY